MTAYYNEFDPFAAAWLQKLIAAGHIAPGVVDTRDLWDVTPDDLRGFTQVHLCAGIGVWSYALRRAGWGDDRPIWTASFPCQPFSAAGKGLGFADERHLWPAGLHLIEQCDPSIVVGEQVASKDGLAWLDLVRADVERTGRAFAAADLCAAGVGAPHIRQRSFWVAHADQGQRGGWPDRELLANGTAAGRIEGDRIDQSDSQTIRLANAASKRQRETWSSSGSERRGAIMQPFGGSVDGLGFPASLGRERKWDQPEHIEPLQANTNRNNGPTCPTNGFWRDADWLYCRDGKWRPVEPGTFPLAHGAANRVGRLRGYGNAIVAPVAETFIRSVMDVLGG